MKEIPTRILIIGLMHDALLALTNGDVERMALHLQNWSRLVCDDPEEACEAVGLLEPILGMEATDCDGKPIKSTN